MYGRQLGLSAEGTPIFDSTISFRAEDCAVVVSHEVIRCFTAGGVGAGLKARVTIARQVSHTSESVLSYKPPKILSTVVSATGNGGVEASEAPTAGNRVLIQVNGENFGSRLFLPVVRFGSVVGNLSRAESSIRPADVTPVGET